MSTVEKLASIAEGEVGYHEGRSGGHWNNHEKYAAQVPTLAWVSAGGYPWCAVFVCWVFNKAGVLELIPGGPTASVAHFRDAAKAAGRFSEYPAVGAIALYGTAGDAHTGLVVDFDADTITAIEGNTNDNGSAEGDGVYRKVRQRRDPNVYGYAYPAFPEGIESADPAWAAQAPKVKPKRRRKAAAKPAPQPAPAHRPKHERAAIHETRTVIRNAKSPARKRRFRNALNWLLGRKK